MSLDLLVINGRSVGKVFRLGATRMLVCGRAASADIQIDDDGVSPRHFEISTDADATWLADTSTSGTLVNGERVTRVRLALNDKVIIGGSTVIKVIEFDSLRAMNVCRCGDNPRDGLTGTLQKKPLADEIKVRFVDATRRRAPLSIMLIDVDGFRHANDVHGFLAGDRVLKTVSEVLVGAVGAHGLVGRYGGDEFAVVLSDTHLDNAGALAERLRRQIEETPVVSHEGAPIAVTISVGAATLVFDEDGAPSFVTPKALVNAANAALTNAKTAGRNRAIHATLLRR